MKTDIDKSNLKRPAICLGGTRYFDLQAVAEMAGVSRQTLWHWRSRGGIPVGRKHRNRMLFTEDETALIMRRAERLEPAERSAPATADGSTRKLRVVIVYSGGVDSSVLLHQMARDGHDVCALSMDYGQRHGRELTFASSMCRAMKIKHEVVDLNSINRLLQGNSLTSKKISVPEGHYSEETMKHTIVPNRNMIMLSIAAGWALSMGCHAVAYAAHGGDHAIYPDCRREFTEAMDRALQLADWKELRLLCPFVSWSKAEIVRLGQELGVPFEKTWSCYKGGRQHCGRCGTCVERREAFYLAGIADPTTYASTAPPIEEMISSNWRIRK